MVTRKTSGFTESSPFLTIFLYHRSYFMPPNVPFAWIDRFILSRTPWILSRLSSTCLCMELNSSLILTVWFLSISPHMAAHAVLTGVVLFLTVVYFSCGEEAVFGGSGFSGTISVIAGLEPGANVLRNGYTVERGNVAHDQVNLRNWVEGLNLN